MIIRRVVKSIGSAIRAMFRAMRNAASRITGAVGALFGGGGYEDDEVVLEEIQDPIVDRPAVSPEVSLGQRAKSALLQLDRSQSIDACFDLTDGRQVAVRNWIAGLNESGIRMLRHIRLDQLDRHLAEARGVDGGGLPAFPAKRTNAPAVKTRALKSLTQIDLEDRVRQAM